MSKRAGLRETPIPGWPSGRSSGLRIRPPERPGR